MDPSKQFEWCLRMLRVFFRVTGQDIFAGSIHRSSAFYLYFWSFVCVISACIYTAFSYDYLTALQAMIALFGMAQGFTKFLLIRDLQILIGITEFLKSVFRSNSTSAGRDYNLCVKHSKWNRLIINIIPVAYFLSGLAYQIPSCVHFAMTGEYKPSYGIYLPGVDANQWTHRLILLLLNFMPVFVDIPIIITFETFIYVIFNNMFMISEIIINDIDELGKMLTDNTMSEKEIKCKLFKIIEMHIDYNDKVKILDSGFQRACFLQIATATLFATIGIFLVFSTYLVDAYVAVFAGIAQILTFCVLGTIIEISSQRISNTVILFDWHLLPQDQWKTHLLFLQYAQQPQVLYIAKIKPLNVETSLKILKSIYSYSAVLQSMVS